MTIDVLSIRAQNGLRAWAEWYHQDAGLFHALKDDPARWAWALMQLEQTRDIPIFFPNGKWATLQVIEQALSQQARLVIQFVEDGKALRAQAQRKDS